MGIGPLPPISASNFTRQVLLALCGWVGASSTALSLHPKPSDPSPTEVDRSSGPSSSRSPLSFESARIAFLLNEHFVPIKVDREERPDVDAVYMAFIQAATGGGGWPMTVFLTPDRKPFTGGTYFPEPRFATILER